MNRFYFLLFLLLLSTVFCFSQSYNWRWARGAAYSGPFYPGAEGTDAATDGSENLYVCGGYGINISFGPYNLNGRGNCFVAKYDSSGNIKWAKGDSSKSSSGSAAFGICTDAFGNCYVSGGFHDTVYFDSHQLIGSHAGSTFLVKYDSAGNALWARGCTNAQDAYSNGCSVDLAGNVYITGSWGYGPSVTFGSQTLVNLNGNSYNVFLVKYDSTGNVLWARTSESTFFAEGLSVTSDNLGNIYTSGLFNDSSVTFGSVTLQNGNPVKDDLFLAKYDSSGNVLWAQRSGGQGDDAAADVTCDLQGNVFLAACINYPYSGLISKYDSLGNILWSKNITGNSGSQIGCYKITTDIRSNVYATGGFYSTPVDIGGDTILQPPPAASDPLFIVKYDTYGNLLFAKAVSNGGDDACGIAVTNSGYIYLGGDYTANTFVVGNDILTCPSIGTTGEQVFTAKLICKNILAGFISNNNSFCGGPACFNFTDNSMGSPTSWKWFFPGAVPDSSLLQNPLNICYANPGNYTVTLIASNINGNDTLTISNYITIYPPPAFSGITQTGDSLFSLPGFVNYQWYDDTTLINGANNYYFVAAHSGNYSVHVTDSNGCLAAATLLNVVAETNEIKNGEPNFSITYNHSMLSVRSTDELPVEIKITDALGKIIYSIKINIKRDFTTIHLPSNISTGIYFVSISASKEIFIRKIFIE